VWEESDMLTEEHQKAGLKLFGHEDGFVLKQNDRFVAGFGAYAKQALILKAADEVVRGIR